MNPCKVLARAVAPVAGLILLSGCATPLIPKSVITEAAKGVTFKDVLSRPDDFKGKTVVWAGQVLGLTNAKDGTYITVLEIPADSNGEPRATEHSEGRFIAVFNQYLDEAVFMPKRRVTIVGELEGSKTVPLGQGKIDYVHPLVRGRHIYLWPQPRPPPPYGWEWGPPPYWYPWWPEYYYGPVFVDRGARERREEHEPPHPRTR